MSNDFQEIFGAQGFNPAEVPNAENFDPLPPGWYGVIVEKADVVDTKAGGGKRLKVEFCVTDEDHSNRRVFGSFNIKNVNPQAVEIGMRELAQFTNACGLVNVQDASEYVNQQLQIRLVIKPARNENYGPENEVKGFRPIDGAKAPAAAPAPRHAVVAPKAATPKPKDAASESTRAEDDEAPPIGAPKAKGKFPWDK